MKTINKIFPIFQLFVFSIAFSPGYSQFTDPPGDNGPLNEAKKIIYEDNFSCFPWPLAKKNKHVCCRRLKFRAHLYDNCWYNEDELEYSGWNKLGKIAYLFSTNNEDKYKMHMGWRMKEIDNEHILGIGLFFHQDTKWVAHWLDSIPFNSDAVFWVNMYMSASVIGLVVEDKAIGVMDYGNYNANKVATRFRKTFWFGGQSPAPHKMEMRFDNIHYDKPGFGDYFNSRNYMIWNLSNFYQSDILAFHANIQIDMSGEDTWVTKHSQHPNKIKQECIIHNNADVTLIAGERIVLHKGFHVKPGGKFHAIIGSKDLYDKLVKDESINNSFTEPETLEPDFKESEITNMGNDGFKPNSVFSIYPNPSPGLFTLHFDDGENVSFEVEIMDMIGNVVYRRENVQKGNTAIDIRVKPKGIYFVKVLVGSKVFTEKVVVE